MNNLFITPLKKEEIFEYQSRTRGDFEIENFEITLDESSEDARSHFGARVVSLHSDIYISIDGPFPINSSGDVESTNFAVNYSKQAIPAETKYFIEKILSDVIDDTKYPRTTFKLSISTVKSGEDISSLAIWALSSTLALSGFTLNYLPIPIRAALVNDKLLIDPSESEMKIASWSAELLMTNFGKCIFQRVSSPRNDLLCTLKDLAPEYGNLLIEKLKQK